MDKIIIDSSYNESELLFDKDSYILIKDDVQAKNLKLNIMNCNVTIVDMSSANNKIFNFDNSKGVVIEVVNNNYSKLLNLKNNKSEVEYNILDLINSDIEYLIEDEIIGVNGRINMNIASISYKNTNKNYKINTSNLVGSTFNEISCFGIVKDKSVLNYDVSSFIKNGAKQANVRQNSNILLFDDESLGKNNPVLLIEENDVKASHGSSIGKIDDEIMFYLCSRGLSRNEATNLICLGKVGHLINKIDDESIKESLINKFKERMS